MEIIEIIRQIALWSLVGCNLVMVGFSLIFTRRIHRRAKESAESAERLFKAAKKQADAVQRVFDKEMNYCRICKTLIKLRK